MTAFTPQLLAALALFALVSSVTPGPNNTMLLASGATPSDPSRLVELLKVTPTVLIEISHFLSSIFGLVLILLAFGLRSRLDAAWTASLIVLLAAALLAPFKGFNWEEAAVLIACFLVILPLRQMRSNSACAAIFSRRRRASARRPNGIPSA